MNKIEKERQKFYKLLVKISKRYNTEVLNEIKTHFKKYSYGLRYEYYLNESKLDPIIFNVILKKNKLTVRMDKYSNLLIIKDKSR